MIIVREQKNKT